MTLAYWSAADGPTLIALAVPRGTLQVALADTAEHRAAGLSNRDAITHDGMLLQWDAPGRHPIWMSEMRFALDLVWLDAEGRVLSVLPNVPPCTSTPCPLYEPAGSEASMAVLELPAGKAAIHGLVAGAVIRGIRADRSERGGGGGGGGGRGGGGGGGGGGGSVGSEGRLLFQGTCPRRF